MEIDRDIDVEIYMDINIQIDRDIYRNIHVEIYMDIDIKINTEKTLK
jgi:hypothetical protein